MHSRDTGVTRPVPIDSEGQRYRRFNAVAVMLAVASRARPMFLLFDDLRWADRPTITATAECHPVCKHGLLAIVVTYIESKLDSAHPLAEMLITLRRERGITRLALRGLKITHAASIWESRASGKGDTPQQVLETRVVAQTVHAGIYMKIDEPVRALFVGFLEVFDRAAVFSQTDVDSREEVW
jgi:hypothetical protein